jgi:hypothetical protein
VREFKQAVCKCTLSVVNMRNNAKIPYILHIEAKITMCRHICVSGLQFPYPRIKLLHFKGKKQNKLLF